MFDRQNFRKKETGDRIPYPAADQKEQELQEKYCDVGESIMEKIEKENKEIDHMVDEVIQLKRKLVKAKGQIRCPNCHQYNEPGSSYCSSCGKKLERETCPE